MGREISIAISAKDNFTQAITTMRNANSSFNKDLTGTSEKLDALNKNKISLKVDTDKAKTALKDAEKQFSATGSAADKLKLELASANYDNSKRNLDLVSKSAKQAEKDILSMTDAESKADNRAGSGKSSDSGNGVLTGLAQAGLTKMVGDTVSQIANTAISSAYGSNAGTMFGSTLSGAAAGAAMGTMVAPGIGTAVGAAVGGITGAVNGAVQVFQNQDDAFKSAVQTEYTNITQAQSEDLSSGSTIAANREQKQISFGTLLGSDKNATDYLKQMTNFANTTPFEYDQLANMSKTLLAYKYKQNEIIPLLTTVGNAGSALSMSGDDMNVVATSIGRMKSSNKTTLEYLNPLLERGIPVMDYLSKAFGKSKTEIYDAVSKGLIPGEKAAKSIAFYMTKDYAGNMEKQAQTFTGLASTLSDAKDQLNSAMGAGYNEERKPGMTKEIDWLSGTSGTKMQEAYTMIGKYKASLENEREKSMRDAMDNAMSSDSYKNAKAAGNNAEAGRIVAKAKADAEAAYRQTDGFKQEQQSQIDLVNNVQTALAPVYKTFGYNMGQEFSKGLAAAVGNTDLASGVTSEQHITSGFNRITPTQKTETSIPADFFNRDPLKNLKSKTTSFPFNTPINNSKNERIVKSHATGIFRVPYNNYPALLHEDERVSTGVEARSEKSTPNVSITINGLTVREEADVDKIARVLVERLSRASAVS